MPVPIAAPIAALLGDPDISFLFNDWEPVLRVFLMAIAGYVTLLVLLRMSGQRTLSQMTSFDLVITVTIGSAFGRVITARQVALIEVIVAFATLILLQWLVANLWGKWPRVRRAVTPTPALLYYDGQVMHDEMRRTHLRESDLLAAVRKDGQGSLEDVQAILFEGNGSLAVLTRDSFGDGSAVADVAEIPPRRP